MRSAKIEYGINSTNEKLVHVTINPAPPPCTHSLYYSDGKFGYVEANTGLLTGGLFEWEFPSDVKKFLKNDSFILVVQGFTSGYMTLDVVNGVGTKCEWKEYK